jgi:hypothetical protein
MDVGTVDPAKLSRFHSRWNTAFKHEVERSRLN